MSALDLAKERIAYLKFWLGLFAVTDISLVGWVVANIGSASTVRLVTAGVAASASGAGLALLHRRIDTRIEALRDL
jgi:hypothetical protein